MSVSIEIGTQAPPLQLDTDGVVRVGGTRVTLDSVVNAFSNGASRRTPTLHASASASRRASPRRSSVVGGDVVIQDPDFVLVGAHSWRHRGAAHLALARLSSVSLIGLS